MAQSKDKENKYKTVLPDSTEMRREKMARIECNVISYVLQRTVDITVIIPSVTMPEALSWKEKYPSHVIKEEYPVIYLLHGMGNNHATWCGYSNIEMFAEERNIAVVMISGENKFYRSVPNGDDYERFIEEELPEFVTSMFPISKLPEHTYIAGLSMGGAGALMHGIENPDKFAAIGAFSAAIRNKASKEPNDWGLPDPREKILLNQKKGKKLPEIYLACGTEDSLYQENKMFKEFLEENKEKVTWVSEEGFGHEWRFWDRQVECFLDWIPRTDGYAKLGKRKI